MRAQVGKDFRPAFSGMNVRAIRKVEGMIGFNNQGRPIRRFEVLHGKKFGDIWMVDEMRIETISPAAGGQVKSSTRMQIKTAVE